VTRATTGRGQSAFTVVELLVVIAIVTSLVALLLPVISRARQAAAALACPVAYARVDGAIQLVHPGDRAALDVAPAKTLNSDAFTQGPTWSTNGSWVAYFADLGDTRSNYVGVYKPSTGMTFRHQVPERFFGWADDGHFMTGWPATGAMIFSVREAESGRVTQTLFCPAATVSCSIAPAPPTTGGAYVTAVHDPEGVAIVLLKKDLTRYKTLWLDRTTPRNSFPEPRADPFGEYVAWTMRKQGGGLGPVVLKPVREPSTVPPAILLPDGVFYDWTDDGKLMVYLPGTGGGMLSIVDTNGRYVGPVRGTDGFTTRAGAASWRKYLRR
jgi:hypothetical protein